MNISRTSVFGFGAVTPGDSDDVLTLLDGSTEAASEIYFNDDPAIYSFIDTDGNDVTSLLSIGQKSGYWPSFDVGIYNNLLYTQKYQAAHGGAAPPTVGSTSVVSNLATQLYNNPLGAPIEQLGAITKNTASSLLGQPLLLIAIAAGIYLYIAAKK